MQRDFFDEMDLRLERLEEVQAEMESNLARLKKRLHALRSAPPPTLDPGDDAERTLRVQQRIIEAAIDIVAADHGTDYSAGECLWSLSCVSRNLRERIAATPDA